MPPVNSTQSLTPWSRVLPEKLTSFQPVKKFLSILWNPKVHYRSNKCPPPLLILSQLDPVYPHPTSWLSILILSSPLFLGLPSGLLHSGFPTKTIFTPLLPHTCYMPRPSHSSRFYHPYNIPPANTEKKSCWGPAAGVVVFLNMRISSLSRESNHDISFFWPLSWLLYSISSPGSHSVLELMGSEHERRIQVI